MDIPTSSVDDNTTTPDRLEINVQSIRDLAASIAAIGLINPITVTRTPKGWKLIAGRRRLAAYKLLARPTIPAREYHPVADTADLAKLAENVGRSNLTPVEEALQLAPLVTANPQGVDGVAQAIGRNPTWILDRLEICDWPPSLQEYVHTKKITLSAAKRLARIQPHDLRETRIRQAALHGINARTAALWVQDAASSAAPEPDLSQSSGKYTGPTYHTETRVDCFICREPVTIDDTVPMRVCNPCLIKLDNAARRQQTS